MSRYAPSDVTSRPVLRARSRAVDTAKSTLDNALVRYDAWFLVFVAVILALGATLLAGMANLVRGETAQDLYRILVVQRLRPEGVLPVRVTPSAARS
jgi:hypothetical protein